MTRVYKVEKSRVERYCLPGSHTIPVGSAYSQATPGFRGRTIYACSEHRFRPSHLTANDELSRYYSAVEGLEDSLKAWDGEEISSLIDDLEAAKSDVEEVISEWEDKLDNMGDLAQGDTGQTIEQRKDSAEEWVNSLDTAISELENLGDPEKKPDPNAARQIVEDVIGESNL